jgi:hypothetical protein
VNGVHHMTTEIEDRQINRMIDVLAEALFAQSTQQTDDAIGAPYVWDHHLGGDFIEVDGAMNLRKIALAILARRG